MPFFSKKKAGKSGSVPQFGEQFQRSMKKVDLAYEVGGELGTGGFAVVKEGLAKDSEGGRWALKMIRNDTYRKNQEQTDREVDVLQSLNHPGIVNVREVVRTDKFFIIVMELLGGGELFDRIVLREKYSEEDAKEVTRSILKTVNYLHTNKCVHRDLKPENLIFQDKGDDAQLKITDFGFAALFEKSGQLKQSCGTPEYVAPEILEDSPYDEKCDIWSVGVIVYILLCGFPPFYADTDEELFEKIGNAQFEFTEPYWEDVSDKAKAFVVRLLTVNVGKRPSAEAALEDEWLTSDEIGGDLAGAGTRLKRFNATRKLRKAVLGVIAANRFKAAFDNI